MLIFIPDSKASAKAFVAQYAIMSFGKDKYNWPITTGYEIHRKAIMVENEEGRYTPLEINY